VKTLFTLIVSLFCVLGARAEAPRPNIIFVLIDDLRLDEIHYPFVKVPNIMRIEREGVKFNNAFVTTPLCSPSRASFLTGQYVHKHGISDNTARDPQSHKLNTFIKQLHDVGYETGFVGKWHMGLDDNPRPGIDYWVSVKGQGRYIDPVVNDNGDRKTNVGYFTDILNAATLRFLEKEHTKPFLLYVSHKAIHPDLQQAADGTLSDPNAENFIPAERHKQLYANAPVPHRPNVKSAGEGKPALLRKLDGVPPLSRETGTKDETIRNRLRVLQSAEEGLGQIFEVLERKKQLDNTLIIFTSDEGYFYGEHGLSVERRLAYEESIRIPLLMRYPKLIKAGSAIEQTTLNIDICPTLLEIGGTPVPPDVDGRSLVPLLNGEKVPSWRKSFLIEYYTDKVFPRISHMGYKAVRTDRWKYIHYLDLNGMDELYDLKKDPYEMKNVIDEAGSVKGLEEMMKELGRILEGAK